jgi:hypothetical protein
MRNILSSDSWKTKTTVCWGLRDRWLNYDGVEDFCGSANYKILELPMVCCLYPTPTLLLSSPGEKIFKITLFHEKRE